MTRRFFDWITGRTRARLKAQEREAINALLDVALVDGNYLYAQQLLGRLKRPMEPVEADRLVTSMLRELEFLHARSSKSFAAKTTLMDHIDSAITHRPVSDRLVERAARRLMEIDAWHVRSVASSEKVNRLLREELIEAMFKADTPAHFIYRAACQDPAGGRYFERVVAHAVKEGDTHFAARAAGCVGRTLTEQEREVLIRVHMRNGNPDSSHSLEGVIEETKTVLAA